MIARTILGGTLAYTQPTSGKTKTVWPFADFSGTEQSLATVEAGVWTVSHTTFDNFGNIDNSYGVTSAAIDSVPTIWKGMRLDANTNLYESTGRNFDATTGRFINTDPAHADSNPYVPQGDDEQLSPYQAFFGSVASTVASVVMPPIDNVRDQAVGIYETGSRFTSLYVSGHSVGRIPFQGDMGRAVEAGDLTTFDIGYGAAKGLAVAAFDFGTGYSFATAQLGDGSRKGDQRGSRKGSFGSRKGDHLRVANFEFWFCSLHSVLTAYGTLVPLVM